LDIEPGTVIAQRYRVQRQLGRGGMGEVFAAENIRTGRVVAVKLLRADTKTLHEVLLAVKDAKRMTLGPKQLGEATKALDDGMRESDAADQHVAALAEAADKVTADALRALRQAGVVRVEALPGFKNLL